MFVKLQFDVKCFPVLSYASPNIGTSVSALETQEKQRGRKVIEIPSTEKGTFIGVQKRRHKRQSAVVLETIVDKAQGNNGGRDVYGGCARKEFLRNGTVELVPAKCSMKWMNYGGMLTFNFAST